MKRTLAAMILGLAGCTEMPVSQGATALGAAPTGATQAYFTGYPARLFEVAAATCDGPGESLVRPGRDEVRCESLPDPESAAAIILSFDGTVEDLPRYVIRFAGRDTERGYLLTADSYIHVPLRDGGAQRVRFDDPEVAAEVRELLIMAGGRPI